MDIAALVAFVLFLAFVTLASVAAVRTVRRVRLTVSRGTAQARRVVEDNRLRARRYTLTGPAGDLAQLRLDLRASIDSTYAALEEGRAADPALSEAAALFARLNDQARALDSELKLLEREPDRSRLAQRLPSLTERTRRVTRAADSLRWAAQDRARHFADDELTMLGRDIQIEADALRHWKPVEAPDPAPEKGVRPGSGPAAGPGGAAPPPAGPRPEPGSSKG